MTTHDIDTKHLHWRIAHTPVSNDHPEWSEARPIMVAIHLHGFHLQDHLSLEKAEEIAQALAELLAEDPSIVSARYTSDGKRKSSMTHARRSWDCDCGQRCWGNGGKASHQRACVVAMQSKVDLYVRLEESGRERGSSAHWTSDAALWQEMLNARVEKERR